MPDPHRATPRSAAPLATASAKLIAIIGIIDRRFVMRAKVIDLMAGCAQIGDQRRFQREGGMIGGDGDAHRHVLRIDGGIGIRAL